MVYGIKSGAEPEILTRRMASFELSTTRRNAVLQVIQAAGLEPADFSWEGAHSEATAVGLGRDPYTVEMLVHEPTGYFFKFDVDDNRNGSLWAIYEPGPEGSPRREHAGSWDYVFGYFRRWADAVRREHTAPDLWTEVLQERQRLGATPTNLENTPFTPAEQADVARQLTELKMFVRQTYALTAEQYAAIDSRLDYFIEAANRLPRVDWRNAFVGAFVGAVLQAVIPPEPVQQLLYLALRGLAALFGGDVPEPPALGPVPI